MGINPMVCKYKNMKKQNIHSMYLFIYNRPMFYVSVFCSMHSNIALKMVKKNVKHYHIISR